MFKITKKAIILGIIIIISFSGILNLQAENNIPNLGKLDIHNNQSLMDIRRDVRNSIQIIRSNRCESELPQLRFYRYIVEKDENFWTILSKTNLDMDTLISVNDLSSPGEIKPGSKIFIPNMRGVIFTNSENKRLMDVLNTNNINIRYINAINGQENLNSKPVFIPLAKISQIERSLFMGTGFINPIKNGRRTSSFGDRTDPFNSQRTQFHRGIDIACPVGTEVFAARSGRVIFSGFNGGYGLTVIIQHELGYQTVYGHLSRSLVEVGQRVKGGNLIALSGNTGRTTGPHLHFEVRKDRKPINPDSLLRRR